MISIEEAAEYVLAKDFLRSISNNPKFISEMEFYLDCRIAIPRRYNKALIKLLQV